MREAALEIALIGDDFRLSLFERLVRTLARLRSARPPTEATPTPLDLHALHRLDDLGLRPADLPAPDARAALEERWTRV